MEHTLTLRAAEEKDVGLVLSLIRDLAEYEKMSDQVIATVPLVASESVAKSELLAGWEQGKSLLTSPLFLVILAVIVALVIVYVILVVFYRRKQRKLRRVRRRRDL